MSDEEFDQQASAIAERIAEMPADEQIAAACRGSGNPAALSWLAENLRLDQATTVIDLGAGLGGPAAWLTTRYGCDVVAVEPAAGAALGASNIFGLRVIRGAADGAPIADDAFDVVVLLGVLSVVPEPARALAEARRIGRRLGVLDWCATKDTPVHAGGSTFVPAEDLEALVVRQGFTIGQSTDVAVPAPQTWSDASNAAHVEREAGEAEVVAAIDAGDLAPFMLVATRSTDA